MARARRPFLLLLAFVLLGGGALAWLALRGSEAPKSSSDGPHLLVKSVGVAGFAERIVSVHLEAIDGAGQRIGRDAGVSPAPREGFEQRGPLPAGLTRFRVRLLVTPSGRPGGAPPSTAVPRLVPQGASDAEEHVMGPYEISAGVGARVLQIGVVLEGLPDLDGAGQVRAFVARVTAHVRSAAGAESFETFGALTIR